MFPPARPYIWCLLLNNNSSSSINSAITTNRDITTKVDDTMIAKKYDNKVQG